MSEQLQNQNKKPFYKRTWFFVVVGLVVVGLISTAFAGEEDVTSNPTATESQESVAQVVALVVPDLVGENASDASEELENLGFTQITLQDVSEDERFVVLPTNWFVCEMNPEPTNTLDSDKTLVLLVVKNTESCDSHDSGESATDASPSEESEAGATETATATPTTTEAPDSDSDSDSDSESESAAVEFAWPRMTEIVLEGNGDDVVMLNQEIPTVAAMDVFANSSSRYFGVRPIYASGNSGSSLVNTTDVFEGTVLLKGPGSDEIIGFEVTAEGSWRFVIKSLSEIPKLLPGETFAGNGDGLVRVDETQGLTTIFVVGNSESRYFGVRPHGVSSMSSVINTTDVYDGRVRLDDGTLLLEVTAIGDWKIILE